MQSNRSALFRGRRFAEEIIVLYVRWYLRFSLSPCDLEKRTPAGTLPSRAKPAEAPAGFGEGRSLTDGGAAAPVPVIKTLLLLTGTPTDQLLALLHRPVPARFVNVSFVMVAGRALEPDARGQFLLSETDPKALLPRESIRGLERVSLMTLDTNPKLQPGVK